jgi:glycosyltransferase involved in cell wall biosynthesis
VTRAIHSVLDQNYPDVEIIAVDDGSTDESLEAIKSFGDRVRWLSGPNQGGCAARNRGLSKASADWVMFLDADDYLAPGSLRALADAAERQEPDIILGQFAYESEGVRTIGPDRIPPVTAQNLLCQWLTGQFTAPCAVLWRRSFVVRIGGWNLSAQRNQDGELVMRALLLGARPVAIDRLCGVYVQHDSPGRVSRRVGRDIVLNEMLLIGNLLLIACDGRHDYARSSFSQAFSRIAWEAFRGGHDDIGRMARDQARALEMRSGLGYRAFRAVAGAFGRRPRMRLTRRLKAQQAAFYSRAPDDFGALAP